MATASQSSFHVKEEAAPIMEEIEYRDNGGGSRAPEEADEEEEEEENDENVGELKDVEKERLSARAQNVANSSSPALGAVQEAHHSPQRGSKRCRASTAKERISKMPPCAAGKRSSIYRGVTRHRWTGRYEAHLWDKSTWNQNLNKKGKQVYLGAYDDEEAAARAYDLAALKYWGPGTLINFPVTDYTRDIDEMKSVSREDYLASLRRKSSGFSRGFSKLRGSRHHANMRWDAQPGRSFVTGLPQFTAYGTFGDAKSSLLRDAPPMINLSNFMNWLQPSAVAGEEKPGTTAMENDLSSEGHQQKASGEDEYSKEENVSKQEEKTRENQGKYGLNTGKGGKKRSGISAMAALNQSLMFAKLEKRLETIDTAAEESVVASKGRSESAAAALAAAMAMEKQAQPFHTPCIWNNPSRCPYETSLGLNMSFQPYHNQLFPT